jgi:hypothetical protein
MNSHFIPIKSAFHCPTCFFNRHRPNAFSYFSPSVRSTFQAFSDNPKPDLRKINSDQSSPCTAAISILAGVVNFLPHPNPPRTRGEGVRNSQSQDCYNRFPIIPDILYMKDISAVKRQVVALADFNTFLRTGFPACSTISQFSRFTGILPVPDRGTKYQ